MSIFFRISVATIFALLAFIETGAARDILQPGWYTGTWSGPVENEKGEVEQWGLNIDSIGQISACIKPSASHAKGQRYKGQVRKQGRAIRLKNGPDIPIQPIGRPDPHSMIITYQNGAKQATLKRGELPKACW